MQALDPNRTAWHITWSTYGARLHGDDRLTVDREHNELGTPFFAENPDRLASEARRQKFDSVFLTKEQRLFIEDSIPEICVRGGWNYRVCAAGPDHVHVVCDVDPLIHGDKVRELLKRWLTQKLKKRWPAPPGGTWWVEGGSNRAIHNEAYLNRAFAYVARQRTH